MATQTINIPEQLVSTAGVSLTRPLPTNVLQLDIHVTSSDWLTVAGPGSGQTCDFLVEVRIGGVFQNVIELPDVPIGSLGPKGDGYPHFSIGSNVLGPADQIRISAKPTVAVHMGLVVTVN